MWRAISRHTAQVFNRKFSGRRGNGHLGKVILQERKGGTNQRASCRMANVVEKQSISFELAQKMVDKAVAKARDIGVSENVAILDDGGKTAP